MVYTKISVRRGAHTPLFPKTMRNLEHNNTVVLSGRNTRTISITAA